MNDSVTERLVRLERELRYWRFAAVFVVASFTLVILLGVGTSPETIRAKRFVVVDPQGRTRAELGLDEQGNSEKVALRLYETNPQHDVFGIKGPIANASLSIGHAGSVGLVMIGSSSGIHLVDPQGTERARLEISENSPSLYLYDKKGKAGASLDVDDIVRNFSLYNQHGRADAELQVDDDGSDLNLGEANGKSRAFLGVGSGQPALNFSDGEGRLRAELGILAESPQKAGDTPILRLHDKEGGVRALLGVNDDDTPVLTMTDASRSNVVGLGIVGVPRLTFFRNGKSVWQAP
jgi:hypothetical protein